MSVFVFVVKEAFDLPCLLQDYKDEIDCKQPKTFGLNILIFFFNVLALYREYILQSEHYGHQ